jgi:hypothetical protein
MVDFAANPRTKLFGDFGIAYIRFGKAHNGGPAKRRTVVTLPKFEWIIGILDEWINDVRPLLAAPPITSLWPTERGGVITADAISTQFATVRRAAGLHEDLNFHSLLRSYVTHLVEQGYDAYLSCVGCLQRIRCSTSCQRSLTGMHTSARWSSERTAFATSERGWHDSRLCRWRSIRNSRCRPHWPSCWMMLHGSWTLGCCRPGTRINRRVVRSRLPSYC